MDKSYDCVICLSTFHNCDDIKQLCSNSNEHIMCNNCYVDVVSKSIEEHKDISCPYCRNQIQTLEEVDLTLQTKHNLPRIEKKDNKLHGKSIYYYLNKNVMESIEYINGKKDGHHITYYINGYKKSDFIYSNNKLNGISYLYYDNGNKYKIMNYKNDILHGEYKELNKSGKIITYMNYKNGIKDGLSFTHKESFYNYYDDIKNEVLKKSIYMKEEVYYINGKIKNDEIKNKKNEIKKETNDLYYLYCVKK